MMAKRSNPRSSEKSQSAEPLRRVVTRLTDPDAVVSGALEAQDFAGLIGLIAREVDETVLPRFVAVTGNSGTIATLAISNRRLIGLDTRARAEASAGMAGSGAAFVARLRAVCDGKGPFRLVLKGRAEGVSVEEESASATDLRKAAAPVAAGPGMGGFLACLPGQAVAWMVRDTAVDMPQAFGPEEFCELLGALVDAIDTEAKGRGGPLKAAMTRPCCAVLPGGDAHHILIVEEGEALVLALVEPGRVGPLLEAWKSAFRT